MDRFQLSCENQLSIIMLIRLSLVSVEKLKFISIGIDYMVEFLKPAKRVFEEIYLDLMNLHMLKSQSFCLKFKNS